MANNSTETRTYTFSDVSMSELACSGGWELRLVGAIEFARTRRSLPSCGRQAGPAPSARNLLCDQDRSALLRCCEREDSVWRWRYSQQARRCHKPAIPLNPQIRHG